MAFSDITFFARANNDGTKRILSSQLNPSPALSDLGSSGEQWAILSAIVRAADGTTQINVGNLARDAFTVTWLSNGSSGNEGEIGFDESFFEGFSNDTFKNNLINAFLAGGTAELTIQLDADAPTPSDEDTLTVNLRALRSTDYLFNLNVAEVRHYDGFTGANLTVPGTDALGNYTFVAAEDLDGSLNPIGFSASLAVSGTQGNLSFPGSPPPVDTDVNDDGYRVKITHSMTGSVSVLRMDFHFPTETVILVDQSGSMIASAGTASKWDEALSAAHLFAKLYGVALPGTPTATNPSPPPPITSVLAGSYQIKIGSFRWTGGGFASAYTPAGSEFAASTSPPTHTGNASGGTPIGEAMVEAKGFFSSGDWRRRHLLLLTDGMDNAHSASAPSLTEVLGDLQPGSATVTQVHVPTIGGNPTEGVVVHTFSYALEGETPIFDLEDLAFKHGGLFLPGDGTSNPPDALNPQILREKFLDVLGTIIPVERELPTGSSFEVEDGLERVIFIATEEYPGTTAMTASSTTAGQTSSAGTQGKANGFSWAWVDNPHPATDWTLANVPAGAEVFALYDLSLRMRCAVEAQGLGQPIKLRARVTHRGVPVTGADIRVGVNRPGESLGEFLTTFLQQGGIAKAISRRHFAKQTQGDFSALLATRATAAIVSPNVNVGAGKISAATAAKGLGRPDTKSLRRLLLDLAERARNLLFQSAGNSVTLVESKTKPGLYEGELSSSLTQDEGVYNFHFRGDGFTPKGYAFARNQRRSATLAPLPDLENSEVAVNATTTAAGQTVWTATVLPKTATGKHVGPGLGYALAFHYVDPDVRKKLQPLVTIDNIDGTYSTRLELDKEQKVPQVALYFGSPNRKDRKPLVINDTRKVQKVRVILNRLQVLDDKDDCFNDKGELSFDTVIAPNANPNRAVRKRVPEKGHVKLSSGQMLEVNEVLYEGLVEAGASLAVTMGGTEFDWLLFFERKEKLARYHRVVPLKNGATKYTPDDEPNDPESLADWKVWYTVEVS